jgi:hypothetical protein
LQDIFLILNDLLVLRKILPPEIVEKFFEPRETFNNTLSTLDTIISRFETVAACWAHAEQEGLSFSLTEFEALPGSAILVIPRRLDIPRAIDPTIRLIFERLANIWLARPNISPEDKFPQETHVIIDETPKVGCLDRLHDLLLMGRSKGVSVMLSTQDVESMQEEYGERKTDSILGQCHNTAVFALASPKTAEYCSKLLGTYEVRERPKTTDPTGMLSATGMAVKDLYHPGELHEFKSVLPAEFMQIPHPAQTGKIAGYFITGSLGSHYNEYPFAEHLLPEAAVNDLEPRDAEDQFLPESLTEEDLRRLGIDIGADSTKPGRPDSATPYDNSTDSLRYIRPITGKRPSND